MLRVVCFQTNPKLGETLYNVLNASKLLGSLQARSRSLPPVANTLAVFPEMAFTGYNFAEEGLHSMVEKEAGASREWALNAAKSSGFHCVLGYPELCGRDSYNSAIWAGPNGLVYNYRKHHLYTVDEELGYKEGPGFRKFAVNLCGKEIIAAIGICMDLNPYRFEADFSEYEFGRFIVENDADLVVIPCAWMAVPPEEADPVKRMVAYWVTRLTPLINDSKERVVIICNRVGNEVNCTYGGSSCVLILGGPKKAQLVSAASCGSEDVLIVDLSIHNDQIKASVP
ncbi:hypothetical protein CANCADRAFT_1556 [Tortispora caseinolytica NRRL Y-17796]|uniref:CN hydrolase domain-containing protein n=1 Tax=Tortispora caseinolytica NRRL Y-17796 TaxID=767744 RepID=A0A1E4TMG4_9ASCO|nr:hypothetical protein CANCADRAFT_1556 [Tortispora caseinolytica NRRL Y-17796]